ncbi:MAG: T9SS type A sorting domain-containing protein [Bacteroidales bacterium]
MKLLTSKKKAFMSSRMLLLTKSIYKGYINDSPGYLLSKFKALSGLVGPLTHLAVLSCLHPLTRLAVWNFPFTRLAAWSRLAGVMLLLLPSLIKSQTMDQGSIQTTNNQTEWTTSKVQTPYVNDPYVGQSLQVNFNDVNNSTQDGYWHAYDISDNLKALDFDIVENVGFTWDGLPDSIAGQNISIKYFVSDVPDGWHGVGSEIQGKANKYEITGTLTYTDTVTGQPASVEFKVPDILANYFMGWDTAAPTPFDPVTSYSSTANPEELESVLNNIHDVMVLPEFQTPKTYMEQMNETSPYTGAGDATNTTLENVSDGGLSSPWNPENFTMLMEDHSQKGYNPEPPKVGNGPDPKGDGDLETKVFQTDKGPVTVTHFMPAETVTYPGAIVVNDYQVTTQAGEIPKFTVNADGLEYTITSNQVNDTVFDVALAVKTLEGQNQTYNITVDIEGIPVNVTQNPAKPDYNASNAPNPFTSTTTLRYSLQQADNVNITLYDLQGREIQTIYSGKQQAGTHNLVVDGSGMANGIYFANITSEKGGSHSVKLVKSPLTR